MGVIAFTLEQCPRCRSFELVTAGDGIEYCLVCGFVHDEEGDLPLPHYSMQYYLDGIPAVSILDIEEMHGCMPTDNPSETEAWLKARENEGYEIEKAVLVNEQSHVIWLRGSPGAWNWDCNN